MIFAGIFYAFLALVGRATLTICRVELNRVEAQALSSVIGLAVITLLSTYLTLLGNPLGSISKEMVLVLAIGSLFIIVYPRARISEVKVLITFREYAIALSITASLVTLPFILGGYQFAILRGNGTDAFNYVTMADALSRFPLDWILAQAKETLAAYSPNLPLGQELLHTRWSTSALLAFASGAFSISSIEFEYVFTLILMVVLFDAFVVSFSATNSLNKLTVWLPVVFVIGFWGQFTLDIRAFSQIASLPLLVVMIGWVLSRQSVPLFRYGTAITAIVLAALFFQYPEIILAFLPGAGLVFIVNLWLTRAETGLSSSRFVDTAKVLIPTLALIAPLLTFVISFAAEQGRFAVNKSLGWETAYFSWLKHPIRAIWGGGVSPGFGLYSDKAYAAAAFLIGLGLTVGVLVRAVMLMSSRRQFHINYSECGLLFLAASGLLGASLLVARDNIWAAGKVLSYFSILIPIWMAIYVSLNKAPTSRLHKAMFRVLGVSIIGWGIMNLAAIINRCVLMEAKAI